MKPKTILLSATYNHDRPIDPATTIALGYVTPFGGAEILVLSDAPAGRMPENVSLSGSQMSKEEEFQLVNVWTHG
jgi:hypothetical protein